MRQPPQGENSKIKTLLNTNSSPKKLSSAVSALSQEINKNRDKFKNLEETTSVLTKDIKILSNSISKLWKDKVDTTKGMRTDTVIGKLPKRSWVERIQTSPGSPIQKKTILLN